MTSIVPRKTPESQADWHLSNFVLQGGRSKRPDGTYVTRAEKSEGSVTSKPAPSDHRRSKGNGAR